MTTEPDTPLDAESRIPPRTDSLPLSSVVADTDADSEPLVLVQLAFDAPLAESGETPVEPPAKREREHVWWMSLLAGTIVASLVALFGLIFIALPFAASNPGANYTAWHHLPLIVGGLFIWLWWVFLGASLGSFINCVAWRLLRGIPITAANSACPKCHNKLRWHENLPIYGWLALNGQCGSCNEPIPARYFLVELLFAISFGMIAYTHILSGGAGITAARYVGTLWRGPYLDPSLSQICICIFHLSAMVLLWLWALFSWDRFPVPKRLIFVALAALVVAASFWSEVLPITVLSTPMPSEIGLTLLWDGDSTKAHMAQQSALPLWSLGLVTSLAGLASGAAIAWLGSLGQANDWRKTNLVSAYALIGATIGWQGVVSVAVINSIVVWAIRVLPHSRQGQPLVVALPFAFLIHFWNWSWISTLIWWPGMSAHWSVCAAAALVAIAAHQVAWRFGRQPDTDTLPSVDESTPETIPEAIAETAEQSPAEQLPVPSTAAGAVE